MYLEENTKKFFSNYFQENFDIKNKEFTKLVESNSIDSFKSLVSKLLSSLQSLVSTNKPNDGILESKGDIRNWKEFKDLDATILQLVQIKKRDYDSKHPFSPFLDMVQNLETFLLNPDTIQLFRQGFIEQNETIKLIYLEYVQMLWVSMFYILSTQTNVSVNSMGLLEVRYVMNESNKDYQDYFKPLSKINEDIKTGKTRDFLKNSLKNNALLSEAIDPFSMWAAGSVITFLGSLLMARHVLRIYYRIRKKTANYFDLQAKFLDISASRNVISGSRDKQIEFANKFRELAEKVRVEMSVANTQTKMEIQSENPQYKDLMNRSDEFSSFSLG